LKEDALKIWTRAFIAIVFVKAKQENLQIAIKSKWTALAWCRMTVIPATTEAEAGRSQVQN
jgi:hypothetical protein